MNFLCKHLKLCTFSVTHIFRCGMQIRDPVTLFYKDIHRQLGAWQCTGMSVYPFSVCSLCTLYAAVTSYILRL